MAQVNISHITPIDQAMASNFAKCTHKIAAQTVHGITGKVEPRAVTVLTLAVQHNTSISGVDTELQVLVSGNDWPKDADGIPFNNADAKAYFDELAGRILTKVTRATKRSVYVWVTPFVASGWAE